MITAHINRVAAGCRDYDNMSSATILFGLARMMSKGQPRGANGCAMAFRPGLTAETMLFRTGMR